MRVGKIGEHDHELRLQALRFGNSLEESDDIGALRLAIRFGQCGYEFEGAKGFAKILPVLILCGGLFLEPFSFFGFADGISQPALDWERQKPIRLQETREYTNISALGEFLLDIRPAENLLVLKTPPSGAQPLAAAVDGAKFPEIAGTIAGDDTVLIITPNKRQRESLQQKIESFVGRPLRSRAS